MSRLIETICILQGKAQHLSWHQRRLDKSFRFLFPGKSPHDLGAILQNQKFDGEWLKCRIEYDADSFSVKIVPYKKANFNRPVFVETGPHSYPFKFADRSWINDLQKRWPAPYAVVMVKEGKLTDGAYTNLAFLRKGKWYTPSTPLLEGTCRARLLQEGILESTLIWKADLHWFEKMKMFNAMTGWENAWELSLENALFPR